jgi:hypothetical protein
MKDMEVGPKTERSQEGAREAPESEAELRQRRTELVSQKARLQEKFQTEVMEELAGEEGLEALEAELEGDPLVQKAISPDISEKERLQLLQETKIPLTRMFGLAAKFRKFMLGNPTMKEMAALDEEIERLEKQIDLLEKM